jgi:hypothetical protein
MVLTRLVLRSMVVLEPEDWETEQQVLMLPEIPLIQEPHSRLVLKKWRSTPPLERFPVSGS